MFAPNIYVTITSSISVILATLIMYRVILRYDKSRAYVLKKVWIASFTQCILISFVIAMCLLALQFALLYVLKIAAKDDIIQGMIVFFCIHLLLFVICLYVYVRHFDILLIPDVQDDAPDDAPDDVPDVDDNKDDSGRALHNRAVIIKNNILIIQSVMCIGLLIAFHIHI